MVLTEDSPPFIVLRKSSEDFKAFFNEGIEKCLSTMDSGISNILRNPNSCKGLSIPGSKLNFLRECTQAKQQVFLKMQDYFEKFENDCREQISDMKTMFLKNIDSFIADMNLEVERPTSEILPEIEMKSSPGSEVRRGNSSTASSLHPKLIDSAKKEISQVDLTPDATRGKSKRKTIADSLLDETVAPSHKRLKMECRSNIEPSTSGKCKFLMFSCFS
ncbi:hypothetical protein AVEN_260073-1 [Araneus ventricosus]|uniref:Uncharacterized protein n=1 Tax=Araneus ventricosus TaxID=182803 RepID=A0A4Y2G5B0_ARAVE|nr:hypothetical protein AVEN_260073-1 [Araneus ventricosus]